MMKNKLQIALTTLFGVLVFCFWLFVRPAVIMEREALQLFLWNGDYLAERLAVPGGFARYVGEFLVQYFLFETAGAAILAVVLSAVSWFFWILLHRSIPSVSDKILFPISFLPAIVLWLLMCDMDTSMTLPVAVLLTLVLMLLLPEKKTPSLSGSIALVPVGYWLAGPVILLMAVWHLRWLHRPFNKVMVAMESTAMALLLVACVLISSYFVPYSLENMVKGIDYRSIQADKIGTLEMMEYDYLQRQSAWEKVLEKANRMEPKAKACHHIVSLAKYYQHETSPDELKMSLYKPFTALTSTTSAMMMSDLFFQMGFVNFAQRTMFEAMESMSNYNKSETLFYKRWAQKMRQLATYPENIKNHPKYGALQKIYGETEDLLFI